MSLQNLIEERKELFNKKFDPAIVEVSVQDILDYRGVPNLGKNFEEEVQNLIIMPFRDFHSTSINMIIDGVVELVEELTPQGGEANHNTYNDGQRDLRNRIISQLQTLKK